VVKKTGGLPVYKKMFPKSTGNLVSPIFFRGNFLHHQRIDSLLSRPSRNIFGAASPLFYSERGFQLNYDDQRGQAPDCIMHGDRVNDGEAKRDVVENGGDRDV
jgi:hypothetical protein